MSAVARRVALCGNPNVGKSTIFNALTGLRQHTGNWTGKTVEPATGEVRWRDETWRLIDLPGTYSLLSGSPEEEVACDCLCFEPLDAVIVICDATCLERTLTLALQVIEAAPRAVVCVNLMDEAAKRGVRVDLARLEALLGVPVAGTSARNGSGLRSLKDAVARAGRAAKSVRYPEALELAVTELLEPVRACLPEGASPRFAALRLLAVGEAFLRRFEGRAGYGRLADTYRAVARELGGCSAAMQSVTACYETARGIREQVVAAGGESAAEKRQQRLDRALTSRKTGVPLMLCLLALVFYITLAGANVPSAWLSEVFGRFGRTLGDWLAGAPAWLRSLLLDGVYRVTTWVVAVMLPPMAIFFPLFTLLEDFGLLPRVAFNLDRCFHRCRACGKQALCICMGVGCNAVGVLGCRIIQSPRERLMAILTNAMTPCNGRFPTLIALSAMFFVMAEGMLGTLLSAAFLVAVMGVSLGMTLLCSRLLSRTVLKGMPSSFAMELPPFRVPRVGQVLVRSLLDRTLFVLGRAIAVAAPAGLILWVLANVSVGGGTLLSAIAAALAPVGRAMGMDGAILLGFILGFPANEIVLPIILMVYLSTGTLADMQGLALVKQLLCDNGWTIWTALCVTLFSVFHWPCSTTLWTIGKETRSVRWTLLAALLPTLVGCGLCCLVELARRLIG